MQDQKKQYKILVAEDDPFQRLSIVNILEVSNYNVTPVSNGEDALKIIKNFKNHFDLVLLDLILPGISGRDVLIAILKDERLNKIPVIVMSSKSDKSITAECLALGAKSFIVKPVRIHEGRGFKNFIEGDENNEIEQNLNQYTVIKLLGKGSSGSVELVKHNETGKMYALKTVPVSCMNEVQIQTAEMEVHFLKVLSGPTLIKSYHSYMDQDNIHIIMEYAEGGNLDEKIRFMKFKHQKFDPDTILNWISQIVLGVMLMHSKNIIHRDLKCQNIFLTKEGNVKVADFGISKELDTLKDLVETFVGTPYFMDPGVIDGKPYGEKADIWAIGVILYELAFLKKPFDGENMQMVFDNILTQPVDLSGLDIDTDINMLLMTILEKDPDKRPDIGTLASIPCIYDRINRFIEENDGKDSAYYFINRGNFKEEEKEETHLNPGHLFDNHKLDMLAHLIRTDVVLEEYQRGWIGRIEKGATGYDIIKWIKDHVDKDNTKAEDMCQKMLDREIIYRVDDSETFESSPTILYKFHEDRTDIANNLIRPWKGECTNALEVSYNLVTLIQEIFEESITENYENREIYYDQALKSRKYDKFISNISQLEIVDLNFSNKNEALCFFLNVYQGMFIHHLLKCGSDNYEVPFEKSYIAFILDYFWQKSEDIFYYCIGGYNFTIEELKHIILRGNKTPPDSLFRLVGKTDEKTQIVEPFEDPRVLLICLDKGFIPNEVVGFDSPDTLDDKFDEFLTKSFHESIEIDSTNQEICLPTVFKNYYYDFGGGDQKILKFVWTWYENADYKIKDIIRLVQKNHFMIKYED